MRQSKCRWQTAPLSMCDERANAGMLHSQPGSGGCRPAESSDAQQLNPLVKSSVLLTVIQLGRGGCIPGCAAFNGSITIHHDSEVELCDRCVTCGVRTWAPSRSEFRRE